MSLFRVSKWGLRIFFAYSAYCLRISVHILHIFLRILRICLRYKLRILRILLRILRILCVFMRIGGGFIFCVFPCVFPCVFCVFFAYFGYSLHILRIYVRFMHISLSVLRMCLRILHILRIAFGIFCILFWVSFCSAARPVPAPAAFKFSSSVVWVEAVMCSRKLNTQQAGRGQLAGAAARDAARA